MESNFEMVVHRSPASERASEEGSVNAGLLLTIARRDRAAEAAARCGDSPARPVSGLISSACLTKRIALSNRTFPHLSMQWLQATR
jgi:hypothetical protein